jgi:hypothetical protein
MFGVSLNSESYAPPFEAILQERAILHFPFVICHCSLEARLTSTAEKMANDKWKMTNGKSLSWFSPLFLL